MTFSSSNNLYGFPQPLTKVFPPPILAQRAPTANDYAYPIGQTWVDEVGQDYYGLVNVASNVATWSVLAAQPGNVDTLTGDSGGAIAPVAGNIDIVGGTGVSVAGTAGTLTINLTGGGVAIDSFTPDAGTNPVVPSAAGLVTMAGTANQITTTGGLNSLTFSLPSAITAPGSLTTTTSLSSGTTVVAGTGLTVTTGNLGVSAGNANVTGNVVASKSSAGVAVTVQATNSDNTNGASNSGVEIATGGASGGDPYLSFQISGVGASTMTMGLDNSASDIFVISNSAAIGTSNALSLTQAGALTTASTIESTVGNITATNGNLVMGTAGNKIIVPTGANASAGLSAAMSGTPGAVVVSTTACSGTALVFYSRATTGGTVGNVSITAQDGTGFTLTSDANETSTFNWWIINA